MIYIIFHCSPVIPCTKFDQSIFIAMHYLVYISINDFTVSSVIPLKTNCFEGMSNRLMGATLHITQVDTFFIMFFIILQWCQRLSARKLRIIHQQYIHMSLAEGSIELFNFLTIYSAIRYCMMFYYTITRPTLSLKF